ncbi:hypothetical protein ACQPYK_25065 [Streptosporangium sp. CA-135522]|uniref:hypothetical protein n=1 Tax=Streptosporangium sp. CA-135522 TaxID=3240072 RepID=UPI003D91E77D
MYWLDEAELTARVIDFDERDRRRAAREVAYRACAARAVDTLRKTGTPYGYQKP